MRGWSERRSFVGRPLRSTGASGWGTGAAAVLLLAGLLLSSVAARAFSFPDLTGFEYAEEVPDPELAEMRGRFIEGGEVRYFGIQMFTVWQTADGLLLTTSLEWTAGGVPTASFFFSAPDSGSPDDPPEPIVITDPVGEGAVVSLPLPATANAGGLETARGVVQSVHAAGDINSIGNDMRFNVADGAVIVSFASPGGPMGEPVELLETTTVEFQPGTKATAFVEPNALGMVVKINNLGTVLQEIRGGAGRAAQHVNVRSNLNLVRNTMNINFGLAPAVGTLRANVSSTLNLIQGLR